jgi:predicted AAA+ superfamily ATPase
LYFFDVGLVSYLLGIESESQISRDPLRGYLFENLVVLELVKNRLNRGLDHNLYFYRDSHKNEVDIIYKRGHLLVPIEIKSASTYSPSLLKGLKYYSSLAKERVKGAYLIYSGEHEQKINSINIINFMNSVKAVE